MCLIIDSDRFFNVLSEPVSEDFRPIVNWLRRRRGKLIYSFSGKYGNELNDNAKIRLAQYKTAGYAESVDENKLSEYTEEVSKNPSLVSNDAHIIALALISGARLLFTGDSDLMDDFRNRKVLTGKKRGKIYSGSQNAKLLESYKCEK